MHHRGARAFGERLGNPEGGVDHRAHQLRRLLCHHLRHLRHHLPHRCDRRRRLPMSSGGRRRRGRRRAHDLEHRLAHLRRLRGVEAAAAAAAPPLGLGRLVCVGAREQRGASLRRRLRVAALQFISRVREHRINHRRADHGQSQHRRARRRARRRAEAIFHGHKQRQVARGEQHVKLRLESRRAAQANLWVGSGSQVQAGGSGLAVLVLALASTQLERRIAAHQ